MSGYYKSVLSEQRELARERKKQWHKSPMSTVWIVLGVIPFAAMLLATTLAWMAVWVVTYTTSGGDYLPNDAAWWARIAWQLTGIWVLTMVPFGVLYHVRSKRLDPW